jgi:ribosomal protein S6
MVIAKTDSSDQVFGKIEKFLKDIDAVSVKAEKLGKKILAYPIAKQTEAEYFLYYFEAEGKDLKALSDKIRLEQETVLRHLLITVAKVSKAKRHQGHKTFPEKVEEKKTEEVKVKPTVTVTTKTKESSSNAFASEDKKVTNESKESKVKKPKTEKKGKKNN